MLPGIARRGMAAFADVILEEGGLDAAARYLETARRLGFLLKVHADQFTCGGGALLAVQHGAASADHLEYAGAEEVEALAHSGTVATLLPGSAFYLGTSRYAPARALVEAGAAIALASNFNPNTSPTYSMPAMLALACSQMRLTPSEAIAAATINGAHALRRAGEVGSLEVGKTADFIVLNAADYREVPCRLGRQPGTHYGEARPDHIPRGRGSVGLFRRRRRLERDHHFAFNLAARGDELLAIRHGIAVRRHGPALLALDAPLLEHKGGAGAELAIVDGLRVLVIAQRSGTPDHAAGPASAAAAHSESESPRHRAAEHFQRARSLLHGRVRQRIYCAVELLARIAELFDHAVGVGYRDIGQGVRYAVQVGFIRHARIIDRPTAC